MVAFTMPRSRSMAPVAARCDTVSIIGVPPPTLALASSAATRRSARSASSAPCVARSALLAVTYGLPRSSARRAQVSGPSRPPASSTTMSASSAALGVTDLDPLRQVGALAVAHGDRLERQWKRSGPNELAESRADRPPADEADAQPLGHGDGLRIISGLSGTRIDRRCADDPPDDSTVVRTAPPVVGPEASPLALGRSASP